MKRVFANVSLLLFPSLVFCQANSDAVKIKKEGLREIRFYVHETDSFPSDALYYDKEGRVRKFIEVISNHQDPSLRHILIEEFDSLGRNTKCTFSYFREKDLDQAKMVNDNGGTRTYFYYGDSVKIEIDSSWKKNQLVDLQIIKTIVHWEKTPPPSPRPVLWQDSIESVFMEIHKSYKYYYRDLSSRVPQSIDSGTSILSVSYSISNNELIGIEHYESNKKDDEITSGDLTKIYTLNQKYDTVTWISSSKENLDKNKGGYTYPRLSVFGNYVFIRTIETNRSGDKYIVHTDETSSGDLQVCEECLNQNIKTKEPWNDSGITKYFEDGYHYEQEYELEVAKQLFAADRVEKIRY